MKITMAAPYDIKSNMSWSGTPLSLYNALTGYIGNEVDTINLSEFHTEKSIKKNLLNTIDLKQSLKNRHPVSKLGPSVMNPLNSRILNNVCNKSNCDVLIEFGGFLPGKNLPPYYIYTDASHDLSLDFYKKTGSLPVDNKFSLYEMQNAAEYARTIYQNAAGVFCMSDFLAESLVKTTGVEADKVHTVYAGANWHGITIPTVEPKSIEGKKEINILLTGIDFYRKGIDIALEAITLLNNGGNKKFTLNLCGPKEKVPQKDYIINHGFIDKSKLVELLQKCDLFVLPSRFDCFGIAFVEAMTFGLPCIGRKLCAMPEIIDEGVNGELITDDDPIKLAELIVKICSDEDLYRSYSVSAIKKSKMFTWENTSKKIMSIIKNDIANGE